jgi:hypothetical protein
MPAASFQTSFGTISRGAVGRRLRRRDALFTAYPRLEEMTRRAEACGEGDQADSFEDLYLEDLVFANAIASAKIMDCERVAGANSNLTGLIEGFGRSGGCGGDRERYRGLGDEVFCSNGRPAIRPYVRCDGTCESRFGFSMTLS